MPVTGTGTATRAPNLAITPSRLDYGSVMVGTTNSLQLRFENTGNTSLSGSLSVAAPFAVIGSSTYSLASGGNQTVLDSVCSDANGQLLPELKHDGWMERHCSGHRRSSPAFRCIVVAILQRFRRRDNRTIYPESKWNYLAVGPNHRLLQTAAWLTFTFRVLQAGNYTVSAYVYAPDDGANSAFINIDGEPTTAMVWSVPVSANPTSRMVTYAGNTSPQVWNLTAGVHQLVLRGREAGMQIQRFSLVAADSTLNPTSVGGVQFQANP